MMAVGSSEQLKQSKSAGAIAAIALLAGVACAGWYWMALLSREFVWDDSSAGRPIATVMVLLALQWLVWGGIVWIASMLNASKQKQVAALCCAAGIVALLFFLNANPILEHDGYRYLWDASTLASGASPYRYAPLAIKDTRRGDGDAVRRALALRARSDWEASSSLDKVGYPEIKTIYPPAAQFSFLAAYTISGWSWSGLRIVFVAAYFAGALLTSAALRSTRALTMFALCPLAIKEIGNSAHVDGTLVLYFGAILLALSWADRVRPLWLAVTVGGLMALAITTKLYPIIALPILAAWFASRFTWAMGALFIAVTAACVGLLYAPFLAMGERDFFSALGPFGSAWQRNEGVFGLLRWAATFFLGESTVSIASIRGASGSAGTVAAKLAALALLLATCLGCSRIVFKSARTEDPVRLISRCMGLLFLAWFVLLPMAFPWYLIGALPFVICASVGPGAWGAVAWPLFACAGVFYYGEFYIDAHNLPGRTLDQLHGIEYGLAFLLTLGFWLRRRAEWRALEQAG